MLCIFLASHAQAFFVVHKKQLFSRAITNTIAAQVTPVDSDMSF